MTGRRLADFPVVFLSYDEPWAEDTWKSLHAVRPDAKRVHGVKGLNACHVAAADAAVGDWFLTVDADTTVAASAFEANVPELYLQPAFRLDWLSRNVVNGVVSGNGCLKLWPRQLALAMRSHEAAPKGKVSLDADIGAIRPGVTRTILMPGCHSVSDPARTPQHAFRAGFREAAFLAHTLTRLAEQGQADTSRRETVARTLRIWCSVGRHVTNGDWVIYGARLAVWMQQNWPGWNKMCVNDYGRLETFWRTKVLERIGPGGCRCRWSGTTWDAHRLDEESRALGDRIDEMQNLGIADYNPSESRLIAEAGLFPAARSGTALDALGRAFHKGQGVPVDITAARHHYETAAILGHPAAFNNLGRLHHLELIPDADPAEARRLYGEATALGNPHAPYHLANLLRTNHPDDATISDRVEALLDLAAERGVADEEPGNRTAG